MGSLEENEIASMVHATGSTPVAGTVFILNCLTNLFIQMERLPKAEYFQKRYQQAIKDGQAQKAAYYKGRLEQMGKVVRPSGVTVNTVNAATDKKAAAKVDGLSHQDQVRRAVNVWNAPKGTAQEKHSFLASAGLNEDVILEALNIASNGELLAAAGL